MKIRFSLSADKPAYRIEDNRGKLVANWKTDLAEEEHDDYLPPGYHYNKVLELSSIAASTVGAGYGKSLMNEFLTSPVTKRAELIFLDPTPYQGEFFGSNLPDHVQVERLQKFYRQFGFRNNPIGDRMWLVLKGKIDTSDLPT